MSEFFCIVSAYKFCLSLKKFGTIFTDFLPKERANLAREKKAGGMYKPLSYTATEISISILNFNNVGINSIVQP